MKIKTSELIGSSLDWAVAECEGKGNEFLRQRKLYPSMSAGPSNSWALGGPIIEREDIEVIRTTLNWGACVYQDRLCGGVFIEGSTPLAAAMRCYVASKLGDEVEVPGELK